MPEPSSKDPDSILGNNESRLRGTLGRIGEIVNCNPELLDGYLAVGVKIDGSLSIAHNFCCLPHALNSIAIQIAARGSKTTLRYSDDQGHKS